MIYGLVILLLLISLLLGLGVFFVRTSLYPKVAPLKDTLNYELEHQSFNNNRYEEMEKHNFTLGSRYDYDLNCIWLPNKESIKTIIIVHGYTVNHHTSLRYLDLFFDKGYNVLLYDQRYHGKSGGKNCTMGYYEKYDLNDLVTWVKDKKGEDSIVGIHGESMGAATVIMHAAIDHRITFTIADCAFEDLYNQFAYRLKIEYKLPAFPMLYIANVLSKLMVGVSYKMVSPIKEVDKITTPMMYIHGDKDNFTRTVDSQSLYTQTKGVKEIYITKGANHAESIYVNPTKYEEKVFTFIESLS